MMRTGDAGRRPDGSGLLDAMRPAGTLKSAIGKRPGADAASRHSVAGVVVPQIRPVPKSGDHSGLGRSRFAVVDIVRRQIDKFGSASAPSRRANREENPMRLPAALAVPLLLCLAPVADAMLTFPDPWPPPDTVAGIEGERVTFPSHSPFAPVEIGTGDDHPTTAIATLFRPPAALPGARHPAVIMLHGSAGVIEAREMTYGRQFAAMGVAALVIDTFGARRDMATAFVDRLLRITETMMLADAYAALGFLARRPDIDPDRIVLIGFSYGGMASVFAAYEQVARLLAPEGLRFAGHVAFYGPCIARFEDRRTTGAPVLMLFGGRDEIMDRGRCAEIISDLREGGSRAGMVVYEEAHHQWDGGWTGPRRIGWDISPCRLRVNADGTVRDRRTFLPMRGSFTRRIILGLCADRDGYLVGRDDSVRARSNRDLARFLAGIFNGAPVR